MSKSHGSKGQLSQRTICHKISLSLATYALSEQELKPSDRLQRLISHSLHGANNDSLERLGPLTGCGYLC